MEIDKLMRLTIYSHFFKVDKLSPRAIEAVRRFAGKYVKYGFKPTKRGRETKYIRVAESIFAGSTVDRSEYRFHIHELDEFKKTLSREYIPDSLIEIVNKKPSTGKDIDLPMVEGWDLREYQIPIMDYILEPVQPHKFLGIQTGKGKDQPLTAKIKTPGGWSTMGDMKVGTEIVSRDGTTTKVIGVYPQGKKDVYKITFSDGRSTECGLNHLWKIFHINTSVHKRWKVVDTEEIIRLLTLHNPRIYVDLIEPEIYPDIDLPLDPYVLGVILGDGSIGKYQINIHSPDESIITEVENLLPVELKINRRGFCNNSIIKSLQGKEYNKIRVILKGLNLTEKLSYQKHIPELYLNSSKQQRISLLQGLMDTDGTVNVDGNISFSTTSKDLANNVQYIVRSLGGLANIYTRTPEYTYLGEKLSGRLAYNVNIRIKNPNELFRLPSKKDKAPLSNQYSDNLKLRIKSIEKIDNVETQCIAVDHPDHLYVTDDFIVTHNTFLSLSGLSDYGKRAIIIVRPMFMDKWILDIPKYLDIKPEEIMSIRGSAELQALLELQANGDLDDTKIIVISNKTLQNWFKLYSEHKEYVLELGYACLPEDMFEFLEAGVRLIDEVHMDFHLNFKIDLYTNVGKSISLSATLDNNDPFMRSMYEIAYPISLRYKAMAIDKYSIARCVLYYLQDGRKIKTVENGRTSYSQNAYEESILAKQDFTDNYLDLIKFVFEIGFMKDYVRGERCIIFAYKVEMCGLIAEHLQKYYPQLDVRRYVSEDPIENMNDPDVRVTTIGSGSTAHDVAMLKTAIMTVNVSSLQSNIQAFGRLRKIEGLLTKFYYLTCVDIPKHMEYHADKIELFKHRALNFNIIDPPGNV